ncbi:MAG: isoprenylcysteine carboxylmethyltransferase family protein [Anaerolineae bacterium]|nr:isoprenylcysteine carboxylmethyltransferase family protein [Anaerolineae bacterium]
MVTETAFRILFGLIYAAFFYVRIRGHMRAGTVSVKRRVVYHENPMLTVLRILVVPLLIAFVLYVFVPNSLPWATVELPTWLRLAGVPIALAGVALLAWVHHTLGKNFSGRLELRSDHTLVTSGPYRWMRHPMYTAFILSLGGGFLVSANWCIGLLPLIAILFIMIVRTPQEEAMMIDQFGETYRAYMQRTARYLPGLI